MKRALLAFVLPALLASAVQAQTRLDGYWEGLLGGTRVNDAQPWDLWRPSNYFELKLFSGLSTGGEAWIKFGGRWDAWNSGDPQPGLLFQEGHLKYRAEKDGLGAEAMLFAREKRFWIGNHLLELVREDNLRDDDNAQGIRIDAWRGASNFTYILSDFSKQDDHGTPGLERTDDAHILRFTQRLGEKGSYLGASYIQKNYGAVSSDFLRQNNRVWSVDAQWVNELADLSLEFAASRVPAEDIPNDTWHTDAWRFGDLGECFERFLPRDAALRAEFRNLLLGNYRIGHTNLSGGAWINGPDYRNYQGGDMADRSGHWFHAYHRLPARAVTWSCSWGREHRIDDFIYDVSGGVELFTNDPRRWLNNNIYIEFINGFRLSLSHNRADETFVGRQFRHYDWLAELIVENRLAWLKTQFKIKDHGSEWEKHIFGVETSINLGGPFKAYNRFLVAGDGIEARSMIFSQLQYRPHDNVELLFSYGPENYGDWGELTNDPDFESGGRMRDEFKLSVKTWF